MRADAATLSRYAAIIVPLLYNRTPSPLRFSRAVHEPFVFFQSMRDGNHDAAAHMTAQKFAAEIRESNLAQAPLQAADGDELSSLAWKALAIAHLNQSVSRQFFMNFISLQQDDGAFLEASPADGIETRGYHELIILHAIANFAVVSRDPKVETAIKRSTNFIAAEIQPDHSTFEPWALFAFISNPATQILADQMLNTSAIHLQQNPRDAMTLMLLADALYSLRLAGEMINESK